MKTVTKLTEDIIELDRLIARQREKMEERKGETNGEVVVTISTRAAGHVELKLTYSESRPHTALSLNEPNPSSQVVDYAVWEPSYDLHASTEDGRPSSAVTLYYRARITQSTGEDWKDTALTLSTSASDASAKGVPVLQSLRVTYAQPQHFTTTQRERPRAKHGRPVIPDYSPANPASASDSSTSPTYRHSSPNYAPAPHSGGWFGSYDAPGAPPAPAPPVMMAMAAQSSPGDDFEEITPLGALTEPTTVVSESPLSMTYTVDGKSTIPSDGIAHQVLVASLPFEADVTYVAVPRVETVAYLQVRKHQSTLLNGGGAD